MKFDPNTNEIIFVVPIMEIYEGNIIEHTTSMASKPPIIHRDIEFIHAWVNNFDAYPTKLIDWPRISASHINECTTLGLLVMAFLTLIPDGRYD